MRKDRYLLIIRFPHYLRKLRFTSQADATEYAETMQADFPDISWTVHESESDRIG